MNFDLYIKFECYISPSGGFATVGANGICPFNLEQYTIPQDFVRYANLRGWLYSEYVPEHIRDDTMCLPETILNSFPAWSDIQVHIEPHDQWNEENHESFRAALEWFANRDGFMVHFR